MGKVFSRREFLRSVSYGSLSLAGISTFASLTSCKRKESKLSRPNIVLVLADDMGYSDIGCYGSEINTPNLNRLAEHGLRFTHFHNTSRCCPTRASLLTGLYPHQAGIGGMMNDRGLYGYRGDLNRNCMTIAEVLKGAGYATYMCGKWHVTRFMEDDGPKHNWPLQRGFDRYFGTVTGAGSFFEPTTLTLDNSWIEVPPGRYYYTTGIGDYAARFIQEHNQNSPEKPFFMYVAYTAPHWPLHAYEEDIACYQGRYDQGWDVLRRERYRRMLEMGLIDRRWKLTERDSRVPPWEEAEHKEWQKRRMEVYAAQVESLDMSIGRIVEELKRQKMFDDTLVLFLSDNGGCAEEINTQGWYDYILEGKDHVSRKTTLDGKPIQVGNNSAFMPGPYDTYQSYGIPWANLSNTPFRLYKHHTHAGGVATPLIVHWTAGVKAKGELRSQPGHLIDIMTTCVDVAGAVYPPEYNGHSITLMEGRSLVPAFDDKPLDREAIYFEHERNRAVLTEKWKLVAQGWEEPWELYNVEKDRTEAVDLATDYPKRVERMAKMWQTWAERAKVLPWENHIGGNPR